MNAERLESMQENEGSQPVLREGASVGKGAAQGESLAVDGEDVPIIRAGMPDLFVALRPPGAEPYIMAPRDAQPQEIVEFYAAHIGQVRELRQEMLKRYAKSPGRKCRYQTGDVAYVLGRPFQLRVYPINQGKGGLRKGGRMRTTSKFSIDPAVSLLTLYVVHPKSFDEAKLAFNSYAEAVLLNNAVKLAADFHVLLRLDGKLLPVRMRAMRGRWSSSEGGALWLSTDLIPYPPDCLVYVIWKELACQADLSEEQVGAHLDRIAPGWREAKRMLAERVEPYSLQQ